MQARKKDIVTRLYGTKQRKLERQSRIEEDNARTDERKAALQAEIEKFEDEHADEIANFAAYDEAVKAGNPPDLAGEEPPTRPVFDEKFFLYNFDEEKPAPVIPPEVIDDIDNDWTLSNEMKENLIENHINALAEAAAAAEPPAKGKK